MMDFVKQRSVIYSGWGRAAGEVNMMDFVNKHNHNNIDNNNAEYNKNNCAEHNNKHDNNAREHHW